MGNRCCIKQKILHKDKRGIHGARTSIIDDKRKTEKALTLEESTVEDIHQTTTKSVNADFILKILYKLWKKFDKWSSSVLTEIFYMTSKCCKKLRF
jgi:hypothetical protein